MDLLVILHFVALGAPSLLSIWLGYLLYKTQRQKSELDKSLLAEIERNQYLSEQVEDTEYHQMVDDTVRSVALAMYETKTNGYETELSTHEIHEMTQKAEIIVMNVEVALAYQRSERARLEGELRRAFNN
jgi:hypothetical protein